MLEDIELVSYQYCKLKQAVWVLNNRNRDSGKNTAYVFEFCNFKKALEHIKKITYSSWPGMDLNKYHETNIMYYSAVCDGRVTFNEGTLTLIKIE